MNYFEKLFTLKGKTAVVAGGAGVIGAEMSKTLLSAGADVMVWSRTRASIDQVIERLESLDDSAGKVSGCQVDTRVENDVQKALDQCIRTMGPPQILVNAVGGNLGKAALVDTDMETFEDILRLNLVSGLMVPTKIFAAYWIEKNIKGTIINLTSMTSYLPLSGVWAYNAAKAGVLNLTQAAAVELAPHGIRVNAIAPGFFLGKQNRALLVDEKTGEYTPRGKAVIEHTPFGQFGDPSELAGATLYLASEKASGFVTGTSIPVDGGYLVHNI